MIIEKVKLHNIRSYLNQEIDFPEGSVLLSGDIGSGKSSILLAIEFALFGIRRKHLSGESLLRKGKNEGSVELHFSVGSKKVVVKRVLKKNATEIKQIAGYIITDGKKKEGTPIELKSDILDLLGYPKGLVTKSKDLIYRYTVYTPQEEMKQILTDEEGGRLDTLRSVFGIDKYKRIRENSDIFIRELKERKKVLEGKTFDLEVKKKEKKKKEEDEKEIDKKLKGKMPELKKIQGELEIKKKRKKENIEKKVEQYNNLKKDLDVNDALLKISIETAASASKSLKLVENEICELEEKENKIKVEGSEKDLDNEIREKEKWLNEINEGKKIYNERLHNISERMNDISDEIKKKKKKKELLEACEREKEKINEKVVGKGVILGIIEAHEKRLKDLNEKIKEHEVNITNSENIKKEILKISKCPVCCQDVSKEHKERIKESEDEKIARLSLHMKEFLKEKDALEINLKENNERKKKNEQNEKEIIRLNAEINSYNAQVDDITDKEKNFDKLDEEKKKSIKKIEAFEKNNLEEIENLIETKKKMLEKLRVKGELSARINEKRKDYGKLKEELGILKKKIGGLNIKKRDLNGEIEKFGDIEKESKDLEEEIEELQKKKEEKNIEISVLEKEKEGLMKIISSIDDDIRRKEAAKDEIKKINSLQNWLEKFFIILMGLVERHVMMKIYAEFNELFQNWFNVLIEDESINVRLSDDFSPLIEQNGYNIESDNLSGGEKTSLALAYRLALNKVINDFIGTIMTKDLIILDEPTDGFSSEQLDNIRNVLDQINIKQVIIVSHESKIESFVDNVIRVHKGEHVSSVV